MNILVTGSNGFVGKNLIEALKNIKEKKDNLRPGLCIDNIYAYDIDSEKSSLDLYCKNSDFVFNLAGVNRPKNNLEFMSGNFGFASLLLDKLRLYNNKCPIMLSSSIQASLTGKYADSEYGKSKLAGEELFFNYSKENKVKVLVYRFTNLFGKWCKPNYNSVIATFCNNYANDLPIVVNDDKTEIELLYIDDLINEMLDSLEGKEHHCDYDGLKMISKNDGRYCYVPTTYKTTLGQIVNMLELFKKAGTTFVIPDIPENSLIKKLYSTFLSYLPKEKARIPYKMNVNAFGSFTELVKTMNNGQISVNISKPGVTKGQHWHNSKWELFIVVSGHALIQERKIGTDDIMEFEVSGEKIEMVYMLPGYTHNIINLSKKDDLVTVMWANEQFNPDKPDTYREPV